MPEKSDPPQKKIVGTDGTVFRCPQCLKAVPSLDVPTFPFCSDRCRLVDLNNWVEGKYTVARPVDPTDHLDDMP